MTFKIDDLTLSHFFKFSKLYFNCQTPCCLSAPINSSRRHYFILSKATSCWKFTP